MKRFKHILLSSIILIIGTTNLVQAAESHTGLMLFVPQNIESAIRQAQARYDSGNIYGAWTLAEKIADKYPNNQEIKNLINACISREDADYKSAVESLSVDALKSYLQAYQDKARLADVNARIQDLPLWNSAKSTNTIAAYNDYLAKSTNRKYADDAKEAINTLQLEQDWRTAKTGNTFESYEKFRKAHPLSKYDSEASNNMAKRLADKFTKNSKDEDKIRALGYATNEMTRDYVKNKFNSSRPKTTSSYSSTSNSSRYSSSSGSTYGSTYGNYGGYSTSSNNKTNNSEGKGFNLGITGLAGYDFNRDFETGIGLTWRLWKYNSRFNATLGLRYLHSSSRRTEYNNDYYSHNSYEVRDYAHMISIPVTMNWNLFRGDNYGAYIGMGYEYDRAFASYNTRKQSNSLLVRCGMGGRHWDWSFYYKKSFPSIFYMGEYRTDVGLLGMDLTYYF